MSQLETIFLTSGLTVFGGVLVYVLGQIISRFFIEPIHEQKKLIGEIADSLIFYSNVYTNPSLEVTDLINDASLKFRQQATLLTSKTHMVPMYRFFSCVALVIPEENIETAFRNLISLSNSVLMISRITQNNREIKNEDSAKKIKESLQLRIQ